jgi:hypothetical protein
MMYDQANAIKKHMVFGAGRTFSRFPELYLSHEIVYENADVYLQFTVESLPFGLAALSNCAGFLS